MIIRTILWLLICVHSVIKLSGQGCSAVSISISPSPTSNPKKDTTVCRGANLNLSVNLPSIRSTTSYTVTTIPHIDTLPCESTGSLVAGAGISIDDGYSSIQNIGFNFCFFGSQFSQMQICDNGFLTFSTNKPVLTTYSAPFVTRSLPLSSHPSPAAGSTALPPNSILGAWMDAYLVNTGANPGGGTITTQLVGTAPFRAYIVKWNDCRYFVSACRTNTSMVLNMKIVLYETTNLIDIYIKTKPICTLSSTNFRYATTQGLQGDSLFKFIVTPGRDSSLWNGANTAVRYTPNGAAATPSVQWTKNGTNISTSNVVNISATDDSANYVASASFNQSCPTGSIIARDTIKVYGLNNTVQTIQVQDTIRCQNSIVLNAQTAGALSYSWDNGSTSQTRTVTNAGKYSVVRRFNSLGCQRDTVYYTIVRYAFPKIDSIRRIGCFNSLSNGQLRLFVSGDTTGIRIGTTANPPNAINPIPNQTRGTFTYWVRNAGGCRDSITLTHDSMSAVYTKRVNFCVQDSSGLMRLTPTGGYTPYTYTLTGRPPQTIDSFNKIGSGIYTIQVSDRNGCSIQRTDTITAFTNLALTFSVDSVKCFGDSTGRIIATLSGGKPGYFYSLNNGTFVSSGVFNALKAGVYTLKTKDAANCPIDTTLTIEGNTAIVASLSKQKNCPFNANGSISITATGGAPLYNYRLGAGVFQSSPIFTNVMGGVFTYSILDRHSCMRSFTDTMFSHPKPQLTLVAKKNLSCYGSNDGKIKVSASASIAPYSYSWNVSGNADSVIQLPANTYFAYVSDSNSCKDTLSITLTQPDSIQALLTLKNPTCFSYSNGSIRVIPSGGTAPYQFSINGASYSTTDSFTGLAAGVYSIAIRDSQLCVKTYNATLVAPSPLQLSLAADSVKCFGGNDGRIRLTGNGGTLPYTYRINAFAYDTFSIKSNLVSANYTVSLRDINGCTKDTAIFVPSYSPLAISKIILDTVRCKNGNDGRISLSASGGNPPYSYSIDGGMYQSSNIFSNLTSGKKLVRVRDAYNCELLDSITLNNPAGMTSTVTVLRPVTCYGLSNGKARVSVSGGVIPYTYSWSNAVSLDSNISLNQGLHYVRITDGKNCKDSVAFTITQPDSLHAIIDVFHPLCNQLKGSLKIKPSGGTFPYSFSLNGAAYTFVDSFFNLSAQVHSITISDSNACTKTFTRTLVAPPLLTASYVVDSVRCFGGNSGRIIVKPAGGTGNLVIKINAVVNAGDTIKNLAAGNHLVEVLDANNCKIDTTLTVHQYSDILFSAIKDTVKCYGSASAQIVLSASGGAGGLNYNLNGSAFGSNNVFTALPAGTFVAKVRDKYICEKTVNVIISQIDSMQVQSQLTHNLCHGDSLGKVKFLLLGGTPPYLYSFNGSAFSSLDSFLKLPAGNYSYAVRDKNNCTKNGLITILQPTPIRSNVLIDSVKCFKQNTGQVQVLPSGGSPTYQIAFNGQAYGANTVFSSLAAGIYNLKIRDANLCVKDTNVRILSSDSFYYTFLLDSIDCHNANNGKVTLTAVGGKAPYQYRLNTGLFTSNNVIANLPPASHVIQVRDNYNCQLSLSITLMNPSPIAIQVDSNIGNICFNESKGTLQISSSGGSLPHQYSWSNGGNTTKISNLVSGSYTVTVRDAKNCIKTLTQVVTQPSNFNIVETRSRLKCFGDTDGAIFLVITGATPPYSYLWSNGEIGSSVSSLAKGLYSITITDFNACTTTRTFNLTEPDSISFALRVEESHCAASKDGKITIENLVGGTAPFFKFAWSHGPSTRNVANLEPFKSYTVTITDTNNCQKQDTEYIDTMYEVRLKVDTLDIPRCPYSLLNLRMRAVSGTSPFLYTLGSEKNTTGDFLNQPNQPYNYSLVDAVGCSFKDSIDLVPRDTMRLELLSYPPPCESANIFPLKANVVGGKTPYTYQWPRAFWSANDSARYNQTGYYELYIRDGYGCRKDTSFQLFLPDGALHGVMVEKKNLRCYKSMDGKLKIEARGGQPPYQYVWNTSSINPEISELEANVPYSVTITDAANCKFTLHDTLSEPDSLYLVSKYADVNCKDDVNGSISVFPYGGTPSYAYSIDTHTFHKDPLFTGLGPGLYLVSVKDDSACIAKESIQLDYMYKLDLTLDTFFQIQAGETIFLNPQVNLSPSSAFYTSVWTPSEGLTCADCLSTEFMGFSSTRLKLRLKYGEGCEEEFYTTIKVLGTENDELYVPNAFSPKAENLENRVFKAYALRVLRFEMSIFNRWGEKVFETDDIRKGWDGTYKGEYAPAGVYSYTLRLTKLDGLKLVKSGEVNLF